MIETDSIQILSVECLESKKAQKSSHNDRKKRAKEKKGIP
jgi:hypothetical protein